MATMRLILRGSCVAYLLRQLLHSPYRIPIRQDGNDNVVFSNFTEAVIIIFFIRDILRTPTLFVKDDLSGDILCL
jgi:hypothetical protein